MMNPGPSYCERPARGFPGSGGNRAVRAWLCLGAIAAIAGCRWKEPEPDGSGTIECTQVQVAPQVGGRLIALPPQEGTVLAEGDVVARIDEADYRLKREEAQAALALAQAQLDLMLAGARAEDIARAREQAREARAAADAAAADLARTREVFDKGSATQKQMDDAQTHAERTAAAWAAATHNLAKLEAGNRPEEIAVARTQVEAARARLATWEKAVADCTVRAPMSGVVTTRVREEGEVVAAGAVLFTLSRLDEVWLSVYVPATRLGHVKLGQPARVKVDGLDRQFEGRITFISPVAEFTPKNVQTPDQRAQLVYRVKITLPNSEGIFKPGMPADGYLESGS